MTPREQRRLIRRMYGPDPSWGFVYAFGFFAVLALLAWLNP
jgi:hypothetical protein